MRTIHSKANNSTTCSRSIIRGVISLRRPEAACGTLNRRGMSLPLEVSQELLSYVDADDLCRLMRTCKALHVAGAYVLYRVVSVADEQAKKCFYGLLLRVRPSCATHSRFPPVLLLRTLRLVSKNPSEDVRIFQLLCDVLVYARELRFLQLDIDTDSSVSLVSILRRLGLARQQTSSIAAAFNGSSINGGSCPYTLPKLSGVQSTCSDVLSAFAAFRPLRTIKLDGLTEKRHLIAFLESMAATSTSASLQEFTCSIYKEDAEGLVRAVANVFPQVIYLGLDIAGCPAVLKAETLMTTRVSFCSYGTTEKTY